MSAFTEQQLAALSAPLDRKHVRERDQANRKVYYIEGWHAIAEANRIFGYGEWDRETVECRLVAEAATKIGRPPNQRDGWRVGYIARVRVTVYAGDRRIVREGTGYGSGIDADLGSAHESAIKESETDAMKRALMTFGNPLGLALYDKAQTEVASAPRQPQTVATLTPRPPTPTEWWKRDDYGIDPTVIEGGMSAWDGEFLAMAESAPSIDALLKLKADNKAHHAAWYRTAREPVREALAARLAAAERKLLGRAAA